MNGTPFDDYISELIDRGILTPTSEDWRKYARAIFEESSDNDSKLYWYDIPESSVPSIDLLYHYLEKRYDDSARDGISQDSGLMGKVIQVRSLYCLIRKLELIKEQLIIAADMISSHSNDLCTIHEFDNHYIYEVLDMLLNSVKHFVSKIVREADPDIVNKHGIQVLELDEEQEYE